MDTIVSRLAHVRAAIADAAVTAGRKSDDVKLIAVSKTHSVDAMHAALRAGQRVFGENTAQEALPKISHFEHDGVEWHFLGHLQSNKAKFIPGNFSWLHSLDNVKLAQRLARLASEQRVTLNALIEVNVTGDPNKHGVAPDDLFALLDQLLDENLTAVTLRGLMTIGPHAGGEAELRTAFSTLRTLREQTSARFGLPGFTELSMGMSGDYIEAVKEGSTMLRIGTAIFGERDYSPS